MRISISASADSPVRWHVSGRSQPASPPVDAPGFDRLRALRPARPEYDRERDLPGLVALWPAELRDTTPAGRALVLRKLRRALRQERQRGVAGHWAYDLKRHAALHRAYNRELELLGGTSAP